MWRHYTLIGARYRRANHHVALRGALPERHCDLGSHSWVPNLWRGSRTGFGPKLAHRSRGRCNRRHLCARGIRYRVRPLRQWSAAPRFASRVTDRDQPLLPMCEHNCVEQRPIAQQVPARSVTRLLARHSTAAMTHVRSYRRRSGPPPRPRRRCGPCRGLAASLRNRRGRLMPFLDIAVNIDRADGLLLDSCERRSAGCRGGRCRLGELVERRDRTDRFA
jgi:hypothetical protein